jgi:hypothetical protein
MVGLKRKPVLVPVMHRKPLRGPMAIQRHHRQMHPARRMAKAQAAKPDQVVQKPQVIPVPAILLIVPRLPVQRAIAVLKPLPTARLPLKGHLVKPLAKVARIRQPVAVVTIA